jgi:hypothetical protein
MAPLISKLRELISRQRQHAEYPDEASHVKQIAIVLAAIVVALVLWKVPERQALKNPTQFA